jgi:hypothetical protein
MMLPIEKEMIGLMLKGASTPLDNIRVSVFLVAWSASLLAIVRTAQHEKEAQAEPKAIDPEYPGWIEKSAKAAEARNARDERGGNPSFNQSTKRSI